MYDNDDSIQNLEVVSPNDPDVSFKYIGWLAGLIVVPLIIVAIVVPFIPQQKKPNYKINTSTASTLPSPAPEIFIATAILASVTGDVQVQRNQIWSAAKTDDKVSQDDIIKTGNNASATVLFGSGSLMRVDANSQITLSNYSKDGDNWIIKINQIVGRTWNRVQKLVGASIYEVNTPTAVATVRGTAFGIDTNASGSAVTVDEGTVSAKLVDTKSPERKIISEIKIEKHEQVEITRQKVEEIKQAIEEKRPIAEIVRARPTEKLPEWIEEHKREVEREAPKIEKLRIEMKEEIESSKPTQPKFDIPEKSRIPEIIEQNVENKIEERRDATSSPTPTPTPFTKVEDKIEEKIELRPTPTPTPFVQRETKLEETKPTPTPTPTPIPSTNEINRLINKKDDDSDKKYKKETALNKDSLVGRPGVEPGASFLSGTRYNR